MQNKTKASVLLLLLFCFFTVSRANIGIGISEVGTLSSIHQITNTGFGLSDVGTLSSMPAHLSLDQTTVDLGTQLPDYSFSSYFIVKNDSGITSVLDGKITESANWITTLNPLSFSLKYNQTDTIYFSGTFPGDAETFSTVILVNSNGGNDSLLVSGVLETTGIADKSTLPIKFFLRQNYPNPFNPSTKITFGLAKASFVNIEIFNALGQKVQVVINKKMATGVHTFVFDAGNFSSGIYYYKIVAGDFQQVKKMLLVR